MGAINRYHCLNSLNFPSPLDGFDVNKLANLIPPVIAMFARPEITIAHPDTGLPIAYEGEEDVGMFNGTTIEIYNYVRTAEWVEMRDYTEFIKVQTCPPPQSISVFQDLLEQALPDIWKGRVRFMNSEDAPPCPACGFDHAEELHEKYNLVDRKGPHKIIW
jgi:hypothetical protein